MPRWSPNNPSASPWHQLAPFLQRNAPLPITVDPIQHSTAFKQIITPEILEQVAAVIDW